MSTAHMIRSMPNDKNEVLVVNTLTWLARIESTYGHTVVELENIRIKGCAEAMQDHAARIMETIPKSKITPDDFAESFDSDPEEEFLWLEDADGNAMGFEVTYIDTDHAEVDLVPVPEDDEQMVQSKPNAEGKTIVVNTANWSAHVSPSDGNPTAIKLKYVQIHMALRFPRDFADRIKEFVPRSKVAPDDFDPPSDPEDLFLWLEADDGELLGFQIEMI